MQKLLLAGIFCLLIQAGVTACTSAPETPSENTPLPVMEYPVLPDEGNEALIKNLRQIFEHGQKQGNHTDVFTAAGDSMTISPAFLQQIGIGNYDLGEYAELQPVIDYFSKTLLPDGSNSFEHRSLAAWGAWSTADVLNPENAREGCADNETPLECEFRISKPAVVLIMFGSNDAAPPTVISSADYRASMEKIIKLSLDRGIIPVLTTIPVYQRNEEIEVRIQEYNRILVSLAESYDIPLWDLRRGLSDLPNQGIGDDGIHLSPFDNPGVTAFFTPENLQQGYTRRNLLALQVLNFIYQTVFSQ